MKRVLIVEDDVMIADNLSQIMQMLGHETLPIAQSYTKAIQLFDEHHPDLVTLDIELKLDKTGIDVADYILTHGTVPFLFLTGQSSEHVMARAMETNPHAYLTKPFTIAEIKMVLEKAFENAAHQRIVETKLCDC